MLMTVSVGIMQNTAEEKKIKSQSGSWTIQLWDSYKLPFMNVK